jgi:hypothetical protein
MIPNIPSVPQLGPTVGRDSGGTISTPTVAGSGSSGAGTGEGSRIAAPDAGTSAKQPNFNPEAVTDSGLDLAGKDIAAMTFNELRALVTLLETCTVREHPVERTGECGNANRRYKTTHANERGIDRTLIELERVVRYQSMFKQTGPRDTQHEDNINQRLRASAKASLAASSVQRDLQTAKGNAPPDVTQNVSMPR